MGKLFPSLISGNLICLQKTITELEPYSDGFHIDVMDFSFVNNATFGPDLINAIRQHSSIQLWIHLMVQEPLRYLERLSLNPHDIISVHCEVLSDHHIFTKIKNLGLIPSIALSPDTPIDRLIPYLPCVEHLLIMSVHPGFSGQTFLPQTFNRINAIRELLNNRHISRPLGIDGGINQELIPTLMNTAIQDFAVASAIFGKLDPLKAIKELRMLLS